MTNPVEAGVALVDRPGQALQHIIENVAALDTLVGEISASSKARATGLAEINRAVGEMDQMVQQNATMAEQSTAAAHALRTATVDLATGVRRFDTGTKARAVGPQPQ